MPGSSPFLPLLLSLALAGCSVFGVRDTEQPTFTLAATLPDGVEIRRYPARVAIETEVADGSINTAFRRLAGYIGGANRTRREIAMTAPVETASVSQTIAMTAPVEVAESGEAALRMRFFLPSGMTIESAPEPTDSSVILVQVEARDEAVLGFTGLRTDRRVAEKTRDLVDGLAGSKWREAGEPVAYFYDPPWTIPWLRRNEVAVPVAPVS